MTARTREKHPPLSPRHKRIFAVAGAAGVAVAVAVAATRMAIINWWLDYCDRPSPVCGAARLAIDWWWVALVIPALGIAWLAHWLTRDRLSGCAPSLDKLP